MGLTGPVVPGLTPGLTGLVGLTGPVVPGLTPGLTGLVAPGLTGPQAPGLTRPDARGPTSRLSSACCRVSWPRSGRPDWPSARVTC